ncbi:uncharacterized protein LOC143618651 [Bidens hawaiensis]|uniref:uncharacterized protein LOC143618651 n=1 Tax=Bidens hawaiensis TaxID=980011 RepID=UPI004049CE44
MSSEIELEEIGFESDDSDDHLLPSLTIVNAPRLCEMHFHDYDDVEAGGMVTCRICLEGAGDAGYELISPCLCKGTQQFVHRSCLDHWRSVKEGFAFSHCTTCKAQYHLRVIKLSAHSWPKIKYRLFVARDVILVFLAMQMLVGLLGGIAYLVDKDTHFRISLAEKWNLIISTDPLPFFYCVGVFVFFLLVGFFGMAVHCMSCNNDPRVAGCQNCFLGWVMMDCCPATMDVCIVIVIGGVILFAFLGIAYGFLVATMAMQRIFQSHYHILTKKELTQEYIVEDLHGCYTRPELAQEDVDRLTLYKLL